MVGQAVTVVRRRIGRDMGVGTAHVGIEGPVRLRTIASAMPFAAGKQFRRIRIASETISAVAIDFAHDSTIHTVVLLPACSRSPARGLLIVPWIRDAPMSMVQPIVRWSAPGRRPSHAPPQQWTSAPLSCSRRAAASPRRSSTDG